MKPLPTPEELARELLQIDPRDNAARLMHNTMIAAIRADRKLIAYLVEHLQRSVDDKLDDFSDGYRKACAEIVVMVQPTGIIHVQK